MKKYIGDNNFVEDTTFWDIELCNPLKANRRFGGTYRQSRNDQSKKPACGSACCRPLRWFLLRLIFLT
jgi:hypothetical protein